VVSVGSAAWTQGTEPAIVVQTLGNGTKVDVVCYFEATELLDMARVDLKSGPLVVDVDGARPFYVRHGWGPGFLWGACAGDLDPAALCSYILAHLGFELRVNRALVAPSYVRIDPDTGAVCWYFEFQASALATGVYVFEGRWIRSRLPCACATPDFCEPGQEFVEDVDAATNIITVSVLYSPAN
jgi:hypothetical protein